MSARARGVYLATLATPAVLVRLHALVAVAAAIHAPQPLHDAAPATGHTHTRPHPRQNAVLHRRHCLDHLLPADVAPQATPFPAPLSADHATQSLSPVRALPLQDATTPAAVATATPARHPPRGLDQGLHIPLAQMAAAIAPRSLDHHHHVRVVVVVVTAPLSPAAVVHLPLVVAAEQRATRPRHHVHDRAQ